MFRKLVKSSRKFIYLAIVLLIGCGANPSNVNLEKSLTRNKKLISKLLLKYNSQNDCVIYKNNNLTLLNYKFCSIDSKAFIYDENADGKLDRLILTHNPTEDEILKYNLEINLEINDIQAKFEKLTEIDERGAVYYFFQHDSNSVIAYNFSTMKKGEVTYKWLQYLYKIPLGYALEN